MLTLIIRIKLERKRENCEPIWTVLATLSLFWPLFADHRFKLGPWNALKFPDTCHVILGDVEVSWKRPLIKYFSPRLYNHPQWCSGKDKSSLTGGAGFDSSLRTPLWILPKISMIPILFSYKSSDPPQNLPLPPSPRRKVMGKRAFLTVR